MSKSKIAPSALLSMSLVLTSGLTVAQDHTIEFTNTDMPPIELLNNTSVGIDGEGNMTAQCVTNVTGDACKDVNVDTPGNVPAITLQRSSGTGNITTGGTLPLAWTVGTTAADVCIATSSPVVTGWNGNTVSKTSASANISMNTAGTFTFSLECYNEFGVSNKASLSATVVGQTNNNPTTPPACNIAGIADGNEFVQPTGFTGHMVSWQNLMLGATFPNGNSFLSPIGSYTLRSVSPATNGPVMSSRYISTEITPEANKNYQISWVSVQRQEEVPGYTSARSAHSMFMSISRCAGDLRAPNTFSTDPSLKRCRVLLNSTSFKFGTTGAAGQCPLEAGVKYYINFAFVNPTDGLDPTENTCAGNGGRCEVNANGL